jgi:hypothetical protein
MAKAIINYAEVMEENGAIVVLDQEKAYDKIRHDYLWKTLEAFNLPHTFIKMLKALYQNATTRVAINGVLSEPFKIQRGIRQKDPLSCPIFDLAIEPLACMIREDQNIKGLSIPGIDEPIKANFFADDTRAVHRTVLRVRPYFVQAQTGLPDPDPYRTSTSCKLERDSTGDRTAVLRITGHICDNIV